MTAKKFLARVPHAPERRTAAGMTGRYLVTMRPDAHPEISDKLSALGIAAAKPVWSGAQISHALPRGAHIMLPRIGVALVDALPDQEDAIHSMAAQEDAVLALEPERIVSVVAPDNVRDYAQGWKDAIEAMAGKLIEKPAAPVAIHAAEDIVATWGLIATRVVTNRFTGNGIRIAILDTGLDTTHPDFAGRQITTMNFVGDNAPFHDGFGHGTHCTGTAAGPLHPARGPRYGIAYHAAIFAGRVLDDTGSGGDFNVLQGIHWALEQGCEIVSMSLGAPWLAGDPPFSQAYETAAQQALAQGCLLIAAAGNDAADNQYVGAVGTPGNSPSVLTVAAVDRNFATAPFSNRIQAAAPGVKGPDIAGPGVGIYSSWPVSLGEYQTLDGTSMATPHVAGIAALYAEANPGVRGQALKNLILSKCMALPGGDARQGEVGAGLVQA